MTGGPEPDVVIVGAGPAGSALAARLAREGHHVLLIDRASFPRRKPCGECLNPSAVEAIRRLGALESVLREPHEKLGRWRIATAFGGFFEGRFPEDTFGIAMARERLDLALLRHAQACGARVRTGTRVTDLVRDGHRVVGVRLRGGAGRGEIRARVVIGADGLRSVVVRRLGLLRRPPRLRKIALTARVRGLGGEGRGELHVHAWGCIGVARIGEGVANLVLVVDAEEGARISGDRSRYFDELVTAWRAGDPVERESPVLATGPFDWPTRSAVADGALLVGDAAGYYDPFTGQGIYRAVRGADLAAGTLARALRDGDTSAASLREYDEARRREFGPGQRLQKVIEFVTSRPRLMGWAAAGLRRRPALADRLVGVTGDLLPVRALVLPTVLGRATA